MYKNLQIINDLILKPQNFTITDLQIEPESKNYTACTFKVNQQTILFRSSKITPIKVGQFVAVWKRPLNKETAPYSNLDSIDILLIYTKTKENKGIFIFNKNSLINNKILSTDKQPGKRGFRVYPIWDQPTNKQAIKAQQWQVPYFFDLKKEPLDQKRIKELFL